MANYTIDMMEYSSDANAQAAYVTDAPPYLSNADIDDEDMADITDWADGDFGSGVSSQVTFDSKSCLKLDNSAGQTASRSQDIGTFGAKSVFSISLYCDYLGNLASGENTQFNFYNGTTRVIIKHCSDGLFIYDGATYNEVGTDLVSLDTWQEWTFDVNWTAETVDVYLDGVLKASGVDCSLASATTNGTVTLFTYGTGTLVYLDWFKAGSDFVAGGGLQSHSEATIKTQGDYALKIEAVITDSLNKTLTKTFDPPLDLSGIDTAKIDMRASRTGANVKLGLRNGGGTTQLTNGGMETWTGGDNVAPTGWANDYTTAKESTIVKVGSYSAHISRDGVNNSHMTQDIQNAGGHNIAYWQGKRVTFGCWVNSTNGAVGGNGSIYIYDGVSVTNGPFVTTDGDWHWLTVTAVISGSATQVLLGCLDKNGYFDGAIAVEGYLITTELTPTIITADEYETKTWDISGVADADKNAIDTLTLTIVDADE